MSRAPPKRPRDAEAVSIPLPSARALQSTRDASAPAINTIPRIATPPLQSSEPNRSVAQSTTPATTKSLTDHTEQPAAKRRRLQNSQAAISPVQDIATSTDEPTQTIEPAGSSRRTANAGPATPPPSQVYSQPIRASAEPARPSEKTRRPRKSAKAKGKQRAVEDATIDTGAGAGLGPTRKKRGEGTARRSKAPRRDAVLESVEIAEEDTVEGATKGTKKKTKRKKREVTPEDAENIRIDPAETRMSELTRNFRTGKKSTVEIELQRRHQVHEAKRKQARIDKRNGVENQPETNGTPNETVDQRLDRLAPVAEVNAPEVPNIIIVDGQIQVDESSLLIDRHAQAAAAREVDRPEVVEEDYLSRRTNAGSWLKKDKSGGWNEMLTDQFFDGLRMFGTDFNMISKMFPGRSRHSVKLKFVKEEREDPIRIERALKGDRLSVDMEEFQKTAGTVFRDPKELEEELQQLTREIEGEQAAAKAAQDEILKQRADEAAAEAEATDTEAGADNSSAKENRTAHEGEPAKRPSKGKKRGKVGKSDNSVRERNKAHNKAVKGVTKVKPVNRKKRDVVAAEKGLAFAIDGNSTIPTAVPA